MPRFVYSPTYAVSAQEVLPITLGGTGAADANSAVSNIGGIASSLLNTANGVAVLGDDGLLASDYVYPFIDGPSSLYNNTTAIYKIVNYDSTLNYVITPLTGSNYVEGTVSRIGDTITYTAPAASGNSGFIINHKTVPITVLASSVVKPTITSPVNGANTIGSSVTLTGSVFTTGGTSDTHLNSTWQIATDSNFSTIVASSVNDSAHLTSWTATGLSPSTVYYARVLYTGATLGSSAWSDVITFSTKANFYPTNLSAVLTDDSTPGVNVAGVNVAISDDGNTAAVGFPGSTNTNYIGRVHVFVQSGGTWTLQQTLTSGNGVNNTLFGYSVDITPDGNMIIVGEPYAPADVVINTYYGPGKAYVYTRSGTVWTQQQVLTPSNGVVGDRFGSSVAISRDVSTIVVGGPGMSGTTYTGYGQAYIFTYTGTMWLQQAVLLPATRVTNDHFGTTVDISSDGNKVIISSLGASNGFGNVTIFTRSDTTWTRQAVLVGNYGTNSGFGYSINITDDGNIAIVSAYAATTGFVGMYSQGGLVNIYDISNNTWVLLQTITPSDQSGGQFFGQSTAISSDAGVLSIGSTGGPADDYASSGKGYIFTRSGNTWTEQQKLYPFSKTYIGIFGSNVAVTRDGSMTSILGYLRDPNSTYANGYVHIYN